MQTDARRKAVTQEGMDLFAHGQYAAARLRFETALQMAKASGHRDFVAGALSNLASCQFAFREYQLALQSYLEARRQASDPDTLAMVDANIASLYSQMGEVDSAIEWLKGSLRRSAPTASRAQMQIEMGSLLARQARLNSSGNGPDPAGFHRAMSYFEAGIAAADRSENHPLFAQGWGRLGEELLRDRQLRAAEHALLEAYRVRKLYHLPMDSSYRNLGELRLAQGDLESASFFLDKAVDLVERPKAPLPKWRVFDTRGRVRLAQGRLADAVDDLRIAVRLARVDRWATPAIDTTRQGAERTHQQAYSDLIEAGNRLFLETRDSSLIRETLEAAEENRAYSLRQLVNGEKSVSLPAEYWEAIATLQRAEVAALQNPGSQTQSGAAAARAEVVRLEGSLLLDSPTLLTRLTPRMQASLGPDSAFLSFHLGESISWLWALDRDHILMYALPPRAEIEARARRVTAAIRDDSPDRLYESAALYGILFGRLPAEFQKRTKWLLALDEGLLDLPVAALSTSSPVPDYVVEHHAIQTIPGSGFWLDAEARKEKRPASTDFIGIGDAIYNLADPRAVSRAAESSGSGFGLRLWAASPSSAVKRLALPRLVGSSAELDRSSSVWPGAHILLKGADANRHNIVKELRNNPAVVHFATHFLESSDPKPSGMIAVSLSDRGEPELLQPEEISHWKFHAGLVVLSGCHSGAGATLPGIGLLGLTRAFLVAGAESVLASRWATPDEDGNLFRSLYSALGSRTHADPTQALRVAQLEMLRSGGWRAQPRYWGTYFVIGNQ